MTSFDLWKAPFCVFWELSRQRLNLAGQLWSAKTINVSQKLRGKKGVVLFSARCPPFGLQSPGDAPFRRKLQKSH